MMRNLKLALIGFSLLPSLAIANFTIAPVKLKVHKDDKVAALTLSNNSSEPRSFQLTAFKIEHEKGYEVDLPTKDIIVTPLSFKLAPGKTQTIRVSMKDGTSYPIQERAYRVSVKELPHKLNKEGAHVQLVTEFKIPISITDVKPDVELE